MDEGPSVIVSQKIDWSFYEVVQRLKRKFYFKVL